MPVRCLSDACQMPVRCLSDACQMPVRCLSDACQMPVRCLSDACQMPVRCLSDACQMPVRCLSDACQMPVRCLSDACQMPVRCLSDACQYDRLTGSVVKIMVVGEKCITRDYYELLTDGVHIVSANFWYIMKGPSVPVIAFAMSTLITKTRLSLLWKASSTLFLRLQQNVAWKPVTEPTGLSGGDRPLKALVVATGLSRP